ncbi:RNA polymerase sigma factor [Actinoallomurus bryophytorum]|uniref:RNA polymerase sigma-70 factor (ECF subfamily) n=1 Tax=Actinoallomurus bryophytorum TaxID=1490222 RepID=A0A543CL43_9ACTN|nr:RNA polymerase sigma factor [Actinoallomurus bryophytorum]TQL97823.1 RNA polymerase sigma-70 factor (ECF subfamily) [Actinoallomurus bryophytorum]
MSTAIGDQAERDATMIRQSRDAPEVFGAIFDAYFAEIRAYASRRVGVEHASDIAAETFVAAFRKRHRYDPGRASVRTWLYGFATKLVGKHRRSELRKLRAMDRLAPDPESEEHEERTTGRLAAEGLRKRLSGALAGLSAGDRDVVLLVALAGLSHEEVAAALDIPYGTVGSRLNRARRKLREALGGTNPLLGLEDHDG